MSKPITVKEAGQWADKVWSECVKQANKAANEFKPDYNTEAVLVEEMQRMAKRIEDLEMLLTIRAEQIVGLQDEIRNLTGEDW